MDGGLSIWVDADACPAPVKGILFRAATRTGLRLTLVANTLLRVPPSPVIRAVQVAHGFDAADRYIEAAVAAGDLVITADIPLAAAVLARGAHALEPRGEWFSPGTIHERLQMRALMNDLRDSGVMSGGPSAFSVADGRAFAAALDRFLQGRR
jgi:uncharacterized protein YaiI (UPF0178 family)